MKEATAYLIVDLLSDAGHEAEIYEGYSGRGMYGKETTGITTSARPDFVTGLVEGKKDDESFDEDEQKLLNEVSLRGDNMGMQFIVY